MPTSGEETVVAVEKREETIRREFERRISESGCAGRRPSENDGLTRRMSSRRGRARRASWGKGALEGRVDVKVRLEQILCRHPHGERGEWGDDCINLLYIQIKITSKLTSIKNDAHLNSILF